MANYEKRNGDGAAFANTTDNPRAPQYKGTIVDLGGNECEIAIWERTSARGTRYLSISLSPKWEGSAAPARQGNQAAGVVDAPAPVWGQNDQPRIDAMNDFAAAVEADLPF